VRRVNGPDANRAHQQQGGRSRSRAGLRAQHRAFLAIDHKEIVVAIEAQRSEVPRVSSKIGTYGVQGSHLKHSARCASATGAAGSRV
jgi:hypothetical protein